MRTRWMERIFRYYEAQEKVADPTIIKKFITSTAGFISNIGDKRLTYKRNCAKKRINEDSNILFAIDD